MKLLGQSVAGVKDLGMCGDTIHYTIKLGPYEASVLEHKKITTHSTKLPSYSYYLKIGSEYILSSKFNVESSEKAIELIETALRKYLEDKNFVEEKYSKP